MFTLYPLLRLIKVPPLRVLHRQLVGAADIRWLHWLLCGATIYLLLVLYSQQWLLSTALFAGGGGAAVVLLLIGRLFIGVSRKAGMQAGSSWRLAMAGLQRRAGANSVQMISFSTAIMLLLLVLALRNELLADWQEQLPDNAPNYFILNVAEDKVDALQETFAAENIASNDMYPIVPGRVTAINDEVLRDEVTKEDRDADEGEREEEERHGKALAVNFH